MIALPKPIDAGLAADVPEFAVSEDIVNSNSADLHGCVQRACHCESIQYIVVVSPYFCASERLRSLKPILVVAAAQRLEFGESFRVGLAHQSHLLLLL